VILHWLRWKPGSGKEIKIGKDMILGLEESSLLSPSLCAHLHSQNILTLAQARLMNDTHALPDHWLGCRDLALGGLWATEWTCFIAAIRSIDISLTDDPDLLLWAGGDVTGTLTVKNLYAALQI
jgi:hypothetical protein